MPEPALTDLPPRIARLPVDEHGQPVLFFADMDAAKWQFCISAKRCAVCGDVLGKWLTFIVAAPGGLSAVTAGPPAHASCAEWLSTHRMLPGVTLLWTTDTSRVFRNRDGRMLIQMGPPSRVAWVADGRDATREEVRDAVESGLPVLQEACEREADEWRRQDARAELARRVTALRALYPSEVEAPA
jgi:hypothetical protein